MAKPDPKFVIVIGTSAGGLNALIEVISQIDPSIDAAILIVMHLSRMGISDFLRHRLSQQTELTCIVPSNRMQIKKGCIYIAPPDQHLVVKDGEVALGRGPEENRWRPSIDVLFRSAATTYDGRVIGVILTGLLDDGMIGMQAIKRCGGKTIVQDPNEAEFPDMPLAVLNNMDVDRCISLSEIGAAIGSLVQQNDLSVAHIPADLKTEAEIAQKVSIGIDLVESLGDHTVFTCPDCGGGLWKITNQGLDHYRCYIGHAYTENELNFGQGESIESTLWVAARLMEERRKLLKSLEDKNIQKGFTRIAKQHETRRRELDAHIIRIKDLLFAVQENKADEEPSTS
jgi:two-component system, chemotaxis family, protein-glutamate methylesterase/glutaminase